MSFSSRKQREFIFLQQSCCRCVSQSRRLGIFHCAGNYIESLIGSCYVVESLTLNSIYLSKQRYWKQTVGAGLLRDCLPTSNALKSAFLNSPSRASLLQSINTLQFALLSSMSIHLAIVPKITMPNFLKLLSYTLLASRAVFATPSDLDSTDQDDSTSPDNNSSSLDSSNPYFYLRVNNK